MQVNIEKQLNSIGKDPNYDLITPNGIIRHFIVFIEAEEVRKLVKGLREDLHLRKIASKCTCTH